MKNVTQYPTPDVNKEEDAPPNRTESGGSLKPNKEENKSTSNQQLG